MKWKACLFLTAAITSSLCGPLAAQLRGPQPLSRGPANGPAPRVAPRQQVPLPPGRSRFRLTRQQKEALWATLSAWQASGAKINTFRCQMTVWDFDRVFGKKKAVEGELKYKKPDKAMYRIRDASGKSWSEHRMCDGKSFFDYDYTKRRLIEVTLPPELQGNAIADGPLPFVFGADANRLLQRYDMRLVTPAANAKTQVWIEAYPWTRQDATNFQRATIILTRADLLPSAVELYFPNGNRKVYQFKKPVVNERKLLPILWPDDFAGRVPRGWTKIVNPGDAATAFFRRLPRAPGGQPRPPVVPQQR